jgi:hypothetical protein
LLDCCQVRGTVTYGDERRCGPLGLGMLLRGMGHRDFGSVGCAALHPRLVTFCRSAASARAGDSMAKPGEMLRNEDQAAMRAAKENRSDPFWRAGLAATPSGSAHTITHRLRWYRFAQPPANSWEPSGFMILLISICSTTDHSRLAVMRHRTGGGFNYSGYVG